MKLHRSLETTIKEVLPKKMVFIGGPRQVGKTTLSLSFLTPSSPENKAYLNWDRVTDKSLILKDQLPLSFPLLIFDEIHKYKKWRSLLKGLYDKYHLSHRFLVTGSARLDHFRKGGDSLLGRYRYLRLHPLSITELNPKANNNDLKTLLQYGGFPEMLIHQNSDELRIWHKERMNRVISEDLRDLENIKEISLLLLLAELLPKRVGSPLSLKSLSEDLEVSQPTVDRWISHLNNLYYSFTIAPFGSPKIRAVKKLAKLYLWDWSIIEEEGYRFENIVASHLLKFCHYLEDTKGHVMELRYLRDTSGREIDFVVIKDKKPLFALECKTGEKNLSPHISYFKNRTNIPHFYQVHLGTKDYGTSSLGRVLPFTTFYKELVEQYGKF